MTIISGCDPNSEGKNSLIYRTVSKMRKISKSKKTLFWKKKQKSRTPLPFTHDYPRSNEQSPLTEHSLISGGKLYGNSLVYYLVRFGDAMRCDAIATRRRKVGVRSVDGKEPDEWERMT